jgi:iron-sulfur cluster repair protein YtfE (RIC family)
MDGLELLKNDHDAIKTLLRGFEWGGGSKDIFQLMFDQLYAALALHTRIEEQVFYPLLLRTLPIETSTLIQQICCEHVETKKLLTKLTALEISCMEWHRLMAKLSQEITQHIQEEEGFLFPKMRQLLDSDQLIQLGQDLQRAKNRELGSSFMNWQDSQTGAEAFIF